MTEASPRPEVLFTHAYFVEEDRRPLGFLHPLPPLQPAEVASWLRQEADARVELWDSTFRVGVPSFEVAVSRLRPHVTWLYTHPTTRDDALQMLEQARRSGAAVVVGGPDAGLQPATYLRAGADAVVSAEAESATLALLFALRSAHYRPTPELLGRVPGIRFLDEHGTVRDGTGEPTPIDLDRAPRPLRDPEQTRIHLERWLDHGRARTLALASARGCPSPCGFCTRSVFGRPYRRRSPGDVVAEMSEIADAFEIGRLRFTDELFLFDRLWLGELADGLKRIGWKIPFEGTAHPAHVHPETLARLAEVGLFRLDLNAASGSDRLLRELDWSYRPSDIYRAAASIKDAGVRVELQVMVGLPGEGRRDLDASMEMIRLVEPGGVEVTRVDPGSPALFRMDWERVVGGPVAELAGKAPPLAPSVLSAAVEWMNTAGSRGGKDRETTGGLLSRLRRPLLRAAVRATPAFRSGRGPRRRARRGTESGSD